MINIFKNFDKGALVALAVAGFFTTSWTNAESKLAPASGWYAVEYINPTATNPDQPSNLRIVSFEGTSAPNTPSCNQLNEETPCQVLLDLSLFTAADIENMSVEEATNATNNAKIDTDNSLSEDGYARQAE